VNIGRASTPIDLLSYRPSDGQPSIFLLRVNDHESVLTVFNWTEGPQRHELALSDLNLAHRGDIRLYDVLEQQPMNVVADGILAETQPAHSVRMIRIVDDVEQMAPSTSGRM